MWRCYQGFHTWREERQEERSVCITRTSLGMGIGQTLRPVRRAQTRSLALAGYSSTGSCPLRGRIGCGVWRGLLRRVRSREEKGHADGQDGLSSCICPSSEALNILPNGHRHSLTPTTVPAITNVRADRRLQASLINKPDLQEEQANFSDEAYTCNLYVVLSTDMICHNPTEEISECTVMNHA